MTTYSTCLGCDFSKGDCAEREAMKASIKGLSITSVRWKCASRLPMFAIGQPIGWNTTMLDDAGDIERVEFPGVVVQTPPGSKALIYVRPGVESDDPDYVFKPTGNGFCKVPLSRLRKRDGDPVPVCKACVRPEPEGHTDDCFLGPRKDADA